MASLKTLKRKLRQAKAENKQNRVKYLEQRILDKKEEAKMSCVCEAFNYNDNIKVATFNTVAAAPVYQQAPEKPTDQKQRDYLLSRLSIIYYNKTCDLKQKFGLADDPEPTNIDDFVQRIKDGKYTVRPNYTVNGDNYEWFSTYDAQYAIRWRDPSKKEDREGHKAATELLNKAYQKARDKINILDPKEGLAVLEEFEANA